jgi:hypothetical protein
MFLRRLSILGSMLVAACVPTQRTYGPTSGAPNCYNYAPSQTELAAWRATIRANTASAYRSFIRTYPQSCYVAMATARISTAVEKKPPPLVRKVPKTVPVKQPPRPQPPRPQPY